MADLSLTVHESSVPHTVIVQAVGAIDAKTVVEFQAAIESLQIKGTRRFILDMEHVAYVNSTGLGSLVRLVDRLEADGGGVAIVKMHAKTRVVFDMLGLTDFFQMFPHSDAAEDHFRSTGVGSRSDASQSADEVLLNIGAPPHRDLRCMNCRVMLRVPGRGNYACSRCGVHFAVPEDPVGPISFSAPPGPGGSGGAGSGPGGRRQSGPPSFQRPPGA